MYSARTVCPYWKKISKKELPFRAGAFVPGNIRQTPQPATVRSVGCIFLHLRTKIAAGYVLILFVIFGIVYIWLNEQHRRQEHRRQELEATTYKIRSLRKDVHELRTPLTAINGYGKLLAFAYIALCIAGEHQKY